MCPAHKEVNVRPFGPKGDFVLLIGYENFNHNANYEYICQIILILDESQIGIRSDKLPNAYLRGCNYHYYYLINLTMMFIVSLLLKYLEKKADELNLVNYYYVCQTTAS